MTAARVIVGEPPRLLGALTLWRRELAAGVRTRATADAVWRAACAEATALECIRDGDFATAERMIDRGAQHLAANEARAA